MGLGFTDKTTSDSHQNEEIKTKKKSDKPLYTHIHRITCSYTKQLSKLKLFIFFLTTRPKTTGTTPI